MTDEKKIHPDYYKNTQGIQIIELIRDLPFSLGNAVKYIYRCRSKENKGQDLKKALWYVEDHKNNSSQLNINSQSDYKPATRETLETLLSSSDDFESETINAIYHDWLNSGDFDTPVELIKTELKEH